MKHDHDHPPGHSHGHDHGHEHGHAAPGHEPHAHAAPPVSADDAGSQALEEALRSSFFIVKVAMVLMVVVFLGSGFFTMLKFL